MSWIILPMSFVYFTLPDGGQQSKDSANRVGRRILLRSVIPPIVSTAVVAQNDAEKGEKKSL